MSPLVQKLKIKGDLDCFLDPRAQILQLEKWSLRYRTGMVVFALLAATFVYKNRFRGLILSLFGGGIFQRLYSHQKGQIPKWERRRDYLETVEDWSPKGAMVSKLANLRLWLAEIKGGEKRNAPGRIGFSCCCCNQYIEYTSSVPQDVRNLAKQFGQTSVWAARCQGFDPLFDPLSKQGLRAIHEKLIQSDQNDLALRVQYYAAALLEKTEDLFRAANDLIGNEAQSGAWHRFYLEKCDAAYLLGLYLNGVADERWKEGVLPEKFEVLPWSSVVGKQRGGEKHQGDTAERWNQAIFKTSLKGLAMNKFIF